MGLVTKGRSSFRQRAFLLALIVFDIFFFYRIVTDHPITRTARSKTQKIRAAASSLAVATSMYRRSILMVISPLAGHLVLYRVDRFGS